MNDTVEEDRAVSTTTSEDDLINELIREWYDPNIAALEAIGAAG